MKNKQAGKQEHIEIPALADLLFLLLESDKEIESAWLLGTKPSINIYMGKNSEGIHLFKMDKDSSLSHLNKLLLEIGILNKWEVEDTKVLFNQFLINRRAKGDFNRMVEAKNDYDLYMANFENPEEMTKIQKDIADRLLKEFSECRTIVINDNFDITQVNGEYLKYEILFKDALKVYDKINNNLIEISRNSGLISEEVYKKITRNKLFDDFQKHICDLFFDGGILRHKISNVVGNRNEENYFYGSIQSLLEFIPIIINLAYNNIFWKNLVIHFTNEMENLNTQSNYDSFLEKYSQSQFEDNKAPLIVFYDNPSLILVFHNGYPNYFKASDWIINLKIFVEPFSLRIIKNRQGNLIFNTLNIGLDRKLLNYSKYFLPTNLPILFDNIFNLEPRFKKYKNYLLKVYLEKVGVFIKLKLRKEPIQSIIMQRVFKNSNSNKIKVYAIVVVAVMIFTNPSITTFREFFPGRCNIPEVLIDSKKLEIGLHLPVQYYRSSNWILFSIYKVEHKETENILVSYKFIGIAGNFFILDSNVSAHQENLKNQISKQKKRYNF